MRKLLILLGFLASPAWALGVPTRIDQQGRFLKPDGTPETGGITVSFALYDASTGGSPLWSETLALTLDGSGFYATPLGGSTPFPPALWDGRSLFLGLTIQ